MLGLMGGISCIWQHNDSKAAQKAQTTAAFTMDCEKATQGPPGGDPA